MSVIYVLIPIAVLFVMIGLAIFFWAVRSKQFEDLDKQGFSILFDDEPHQYKQDASDDQSSSQQKPHQEPDER
ncbi:cbb3-type cytochrome oxidase assembly protein CcoS [Alkalimonas collagenimarina]|uniref:Cbb3-type cytochrome oxidase assembly protein CcoS n=1 Tax=Alkalimonas collagenimarina TaxID=400390 RepID=A0ABT9H3B9_9GAMM|nr:cbb3-type cytochrome oxidase assembly protein CcoS [Alkalimonas collagenimarina]MDP4537400.1 cbb3-type cytochrome oxidase assembly protein CcoS [Alkalimonas collagenimarina]